MRKIEESIAVDSSIQLNFQRQNMSLESIFREFIDNSYDSYNNPSNREKLNSIGIDKCYIKITIDESRIIIEDSSFGMDHEGFRRALRLSKRSDNYHEGSLGQFGMGLKYAAISLGDEYTIETTALGSKEKFKATINRELLENNSTTVTNEIDDNYDQNKHYTKITIKRLVRPITILEKTNLINNLGKIYNKFIENKDLEIVFLPNKVVQYQPPELWLNDDGTEYSKDFQDEFEFKGKKYEYYGWIGILKSGDTKGDGNAGLSLHHKNRIILTNYRNENLMGRVNSFAYQRLIGIVHLDDFPVDFNKSSFSWNGGLEAKFIESLSNNYVFSDMKKKANELRKRAGKNTPKKEEVTKINAKQTTQFKSLETVKKVQIPLVVKNDNEPVVFIEENTVPLYISYEGIDYTFFIEYVSEVYDSDDWVKIVTANIEKNEYLIRINNNFKFFDKLKKSDFALIQQIVLLITLAQLSSVRSGFKDSHKFIQKMNEIIKILEK